MKEKAFSLAVAFFIIMGICGLLIYSWNKNEQIECRTWKQQAHEYKGFYLTKAQKAQCNYWKIYFTVNVK